MLRSDEMPLFPAPRGVFHRLPPAHFRVVVRKAQAFTEQEIAGELGISRRTVSSYAERARDKLGFQSFQQVQWAFYSEYAPGMWSTEGSETMP
ncbi:MAG: sigma factor-like helix-turn-helix DNA-binding protein [Acidimicrobiales bacterium]